MLALAATASFVAASPSKAQSLSNTQSQPDNGASSQVWIGKVEQTPRGNRIGNPDADMQLIEFISYTCGHCADFSKQSDGTLDLVGVAPGKIAVEIRPVIRNSLDLVVTMLVQCGDSKGFKARHRAFLYSQDTWLTKAINAPRSQQAIWSRGDAAARANAASALGLDDIAINKGLSAPEINTCLADQAAAQTILDNNRANVTEFEITGTPSFALNGSALKGVYDWPGLSAILQQQN